MPVFEVQIGYYKDAEEWRKQGETEHFSLEATHIVDALHKLACRFPARYAGDVNEIFIEEVERNVIQDEPDRIREGDGWKAREGRV
jgi:hypothetical protein